MPMHIYTNWNSRPSDHEEQIEPYRKYIFICEGANTETFYFRKLIDLRKQLGIHPLIDIRLGEKTDEDKNLSYPKQLAAFAEKQKYLPENHFDPDHDKMVIVFDGDIFEQKVPGYDELIRRIEEHDIAAVTNPGFELFLLLHVEGSFAEYIENHEAEFLKPDSNGRYSYAYNVLRDITGINAKRNTAVGELAEHVLTAISQEKQLNQDIHNLKGHVTSNIGKILERIMNEKPGNTQ